MFLQVLKVKISQEFYFKYVLFLGCNANIILSW